jgi:hypothetical protein
VRARSVGARHALARPGRSPCVHWRVHGRSWACLGVAVLARAGSVLVKGVHGRVQGGEGKRRDMAVQARSDPVRRWHEMDMPCHGMACSGQCGQAQVRASG